MALSLSELQQLAQLSQLELPEDAIDELGNKLGSIVDFFDALNQVDTDAVTPMAHPLDITQRLRADEVTEQNHRDEYQKGAPETENGLYLVPKVIQS